MVKIQNEFEEEKRKKYWDDVKNPKNPSFFIKYGGYLFSLIWTTILYYDSPIIEILFVLVSSLLVSILLTLLFIFLDFSGLFELGGFKKFQRNFTISCVIVGSILSV